MDVTTGRAPKPASTPSVRPEGYGFSTKLLPELRPLQARVVFQEYAPLEASQRFVDLMPDMTSLQFGRQQFSSVADATRAAHEVSRAHDRQAVAVVRSTPVGYAPTSTFVLRPVHVIASGGLHMGDLSRRPERWRGDVDAVPRWHDTLQNVLIAPLGVASRDAGTAFELLGIDAIVVGEAVADRATDRFGWSEDSMRALQWRTAGTRSGTGPVTSSVTSSRGATASA